MVDGRRLTFRLAGINNQNFIMRDDQTGTWWQQVSGLAIHGPLKGKRLTLMPHDEVTFATWKDEAAQRPVLKLDEKVVKKEDYEPADWEERRRIRRQSRHGATGGPLEPRTLMVGITVRRQEQGVAAASVLTSGVWLDELKGRAPSRWSCRLTAASLRVFDRRVKDETLTFVRAGTDLRSSMLLDLETMTEWDFQGRAVQGRTGRQPAHAGGLPARLLVRLEQVPPEDGSAEGVDAGGKKKTKSEIPAPRGLARRRTKDE